MQTTDKIDLGNNLNIPFEESYISTPYKIWKISYILLLVFGLGAGAVILYAYSGAYRPSGPYGGPEWDSYYSTMVMLEMVALSLALLAIIPAILFVVYNFILLYRNWNVIQNISGVTTSAGSAVGFLFIPIFTYYWQFIAHAKLADHQQAAFDQAGVSPTRKPNKALAIIYCISVLSVVLANIPEAEIAIIGALGAIIGLTILGPIKETHQKNVSLELIRLAKH